MARARRRPPGLNGERTEQPARMEEEESRAAPASPEDEPKSEGNGAATVPPEPAGGSAPRGGPEEEEERPKAAVEEAPGEKEEEEAFLVSLYKFMKDRHTPIERIPHLGFKQINLWKIYKAVEKLGAYELVTGRRLWKNVYDELGGSPGSTSAATCTRRHYERLVLPYVRHLKGEDDKPLPPAKPRKQYKVSKEPKGPEAAEKSRRARKDKSREQVAPAKTEAAAVPAEAAERARPAEGAAATEPGGPGPCRPHAEAYKRLFSSFSAKGSHPIMSPLAKKKLLAQVSKAEALHCHKRPCPESRRPGGPPRQEHRGGDEGRGEDGAGPAPAVFTGCFHAYRPEGPPGCPPPPPPPPPRGRCPEPEQPQDLRSHKTPRGSPSPAAFAAVKACWVPPGTAFVPPPPRAKRGPEEEEEEAPFGLKLRAVSPFGKEAEGRDKGAGSQQGLAKPKAVVAGGGYPAPLAAAVPQIPDVYKGAMLRFPVSFPLEHLKTPGAPLAPNLPVNPFVIPAFPSPLVAAPTQPSEPGRYPYDGSLRPRLYAAATWHGRPAYASPHAFHRHTKL
ncbi:AT-rich interactive domain-containing protein 5A [Dromaius novaehollandiae]|uniref:AT-rich interactive domain-containing protein 5A n=1 Tax=Dromaius novaehollandiae TaxID=8790 RepID=UPI00311DBBE0